MLRHSKRVIITVMSCMTSPTWYSPGDNAETIVDSLTRPGSRWLSYPSSCSLELQLNLPACHQVHTRRRISYTHLYSPPSCHAVCAQPARSTPPRVHSQMSAAPHLLSRIVEWSMSPMRCQTPCPTRPCSRSPAIRAPWKARATRTSLRLERWRPRWYAAR